LKPTPSDRDDTLSPTGGPRRFHTLLEDLARGESRLESDIQGALAGGSPGVGDLARLLAERSSLAGRRLALLTQWVAVLDRQLSELRSRSDDLTRRVSGHGESLRMVSELLKELDDPYGFGLSLDERIAGDGPDPDTDQADS
jgi:hypothetical protein